MPHDKNGALLMEGDYVTGCVETYPGKFWEGVGRVVEVREGPVCNVIIAEVETRPWEAKDYDDLKGPNGYMYSSGCWTWPGDQSKQFRIDVNFIQATATDLVLMHSPARGGLAAAESRC